MFQINCYRASSASNNTLGDYVNFGHWNAAVNYTWNIGTSYFRIDGDSITYSMAGHNVPILLKTGTGITRIMLNSPPVSNWFENPSYYEDVIPYKKGDILVLLTDGVTECKNARGEMFGADGAIKTLSVSRTAEEFIKNLESKLRNFKSSFDDDITAIAFDL